MYRSTRPATRAIAPATALALVALAAATAGADQIRITVTNNQPVNSGFGISPVWVGLHDGSFQAFRQGDNLAGTGYQTVAELGSTAGLTTAFAGFGPQTTVGSSPYVPGATVSTILNVLDPKTTRFLNYAAMVVPSNDFFFGNDAAHVATLFNSAGQLVDANGQVTGTRTIQIFGSAVWDAGTEVNNINFGAAFIAGENAADHVAENGTAQLVFGGLADNSAYLASINGRLTPAGYNIGHLISPGDLIATIQISSVPEPSTVVLLGVGLALPLALARRARRRRPAA